MNGEYTLPDIGRLGAILTQWQGKQECQLVLEEQEKEDGIDGPLW